MNIAKLNTTESSHSIPDEFVRSDALRSYRDTVLELGGQPDALLTEVHLTPQVLETVDSVFPYRSMIRLLELTATQLNCPDFGLQLASRQGGSRVLGPLHVAMRNAKTVGDAYDYCAAHLSVYSAAIRIQMENDAGRDRKFMRFEVLLGGGMVQRQTVENSLGLTHQALLTLSHGAAGADEIWFTHSRLAPEIAYQKFFGVPVQFEMPFNAVFMRNRDLALPIIDNDPQLYQLASSYINLQFPPVEQYLTARVRMLIARLLPLGQCSQDVVAERLCMHARTLQRKLKAEGAAFEMIKDGVRQDLALQYLSMSAIPFSKIAAMLGYSDSTVFMRSCQRWFHHSPRSMREQLRSEREMTSLNNGPLGRVN